MKQIEKSDSTRTMQLVIKVVIGILAMMFMALIWQWWGSKEVLTDKEKQMLRHTYHQTMFLNKTDISSAEQDEIDTLKACQFYGDWEYKKADGDKYLVTFDTLANENTFAYESKETSYNGTKRYKGAGQWRWLKGQFIWLTTGREDNNPLIHLLVLDNTLQRFSLLEADGRVTNFKRLAGNRC